MAGQAPWSKVRSLNYSTISATRHAADEPGPRLMVPSPDRTLSAAGPLHAWDRRRRWERRHWGRSGGERVGRLPLGFQVKDLCGHAIVDAANSGFESGRART